MDKFVFIAGVAMIVAALVMFGIGIWTGDERWFNTGMLFLFPGMAAVIAGIVWMSTRSLDEWR